MSYHFPESRNDAENIDRHDILAHARQAFDMEGGIIYLVGHSLGPASRTALDALEQAARYDWRRGLVRSVIKFFNLLSHRFLNFFSTMTSIHTP